jgi:hypothetical protein
MGVPNAAWPNQSWPNQAPSVVAPTPVVIENSVNVITAVGPGSFVVTTVGGTQEMED